MSCLYLSRPSRALALALGLLLAEGSTAAAGQAPDDAFAEGVALYEAGDFSGALEAFESSLAAGYASGALYYNMGNAYFRLDELGQAIRFYEKARRLRPDDEAVLHNLAVARSRTPDVYPALPQPAWVSAWRSVVRTLGPLGLFGIGFGLYLVAAALVGYRIWSGRPSNLRRRVLIAAAFGATVCIAAALLASVGASRATQGVVLADSLPLREGPAPDAPSEAEVYEGLVVDLLDADGPWVYVRLPNGATGWITAESVAEV